MRGSPRCLRTPLLDAEASRSGLRPTRDATHPSKVSSSPAAGSPHDDRAALLLFPGSRCRSNVPRSQDSRSGSHAGARSRSGRRFGPRDTMRGISSSHAASPSGARLDSHRGCRIAFPRAPVSGNPHPRPCCTLDGCSFHDRTGVAPLLRVRSSAPSVDRWHLYLPVGSEALASCRQAALSSAPTGLRPPDALATRCRSIEDPTVAGGLDDLAEAMPPLAVDRSRAIADSWHRRCRLRLDAPSTEVDASIASSTLARSSPPKR